MITHGFPVGELDAASSPTGSLVITVIDVGQLRAGESRPAQLPDIATGSAAIHAAAVTAAAWIAALPHPTGLEPVTTGSSPPDRPQCGLVRRPQVITHGFPVGELDAASSPTGKAVGQSPWRNRAVARGRVSPRATTRHRDRQRRDPRRSSHCCGVDLALPSHPTGLEPVTTGSSPPDEAAVRPRPATTKMITHGFPVGELDAASSPTENP